jgi:hypothetical protein
MLANSYWRVARPIAAVIKVLDNRYHVTAQNNCTENYQAGAEDPLLYNMPIAELNSTITNIHKQPFSTAMRNIHPSSRSRDAR